MSSSVAAFLHVIRMREEIVPRGKSGTLQPFNWQMYRIIISNYHGIGTSQLHTSVRSLCYLHHLEPAALVRVNRIETYTSVCNTVI